MSNRQTMFLFLLWWSSRRLLLRSSKGKICAAVRWIQVSRETKSAPGHEVMNQVFLFGADTWVWRQAREYSYGSVVCLDYCTQHLNCDRFRLCATSSVSCLTGTNRQAALLKCRPSILSKETSNKSAALGMKRRELQVGCDVV